jgi:mannose/fructose/N-acetylgalactosamine-specific phosphotransferase system component IID
MSERTRLEKINRKASVLSWIIIGSVVIAWVNLMAVLLIIKERS